MHYYREHENRIDIGNEMTHFETFSGFQTRRRKGNLMIVGQLVINHDFRAPISQIWSLKSEAQENFEKMTKKLQNQEKSILVNSEGQSQYQWWKSTLWLTTTNSKKSARNMSNSMKITWLFLVFPCAIPLCPSLTPFLLALRSL